MSNLSNNFIAGDWISGPLPAGDATSDINEATLPMCPNGVDYAMTAGTDPTTTTVVLGQDTFSDNDGYQPPSSVELEKVDTLVDTNGNGIADVGDTINYVFTVINTGCTELTNVIVTDDQAGVTVVGSPIASIPAGTSDSTVTGSYVVTQDDVNAGMFINSASVEATTPSGDTVADDMSDDPDTAEPDDPTITILGQMPAIDLQKFAEFIDVNNNQLGDVGDIIRYTFRVENIGNVALFDITIDDPLVTVVGGPIDLEVGEVDTTSFTAEYVITAADVVTGSVTNSATTIGFDDLGTAATDTSDDPFDPTSDDDPTITTLPNNPLVIYNGVSPNNDGDNDVFTIVGIENFPNNTLCIYNRWGVEVYNVEGYGQDGKLFRGISEGRITIEQDRELPVGTYFYVLKYTDGTVENKRAGYLYINR